jgi:hypothetical protein
MTDLLVGRSGDEGGVSIEEFTLPMGMLGGFAGGRSGIVGKY